ncbi:MAG: hypothetical protein M0Q93_09750, partial [Terrimicrobiaceae bacterium]|nr:hypothetical protein [Terrimicrobiaceae bacterium]
VSRSMLCSGKPVPASSGDGAHPSRQSLRASTLECWPGERGRRSCVAVAAPNKCSSAVKARSRGEPCPPPKG